MTRRLEVSVLAVACALGLFATAALAGQSSAHRTARADLEGIIADYGLLVIAKAPPGVNPVTVASAAELQGLLDSIGGGTAREGFLASSTQDAKGFALTSGGTLLRRYHWRSGGGPYWYNLDANVYIGSYGSFTWIDRISSVNFYLSGLVAGVYLKDVWTESEIDASNGQCATISGGATECWYIMIKELLAYYQRSVWMIRQINIAQ